MKIINKDITTVEAGVIGHQVNLQGVMGSGLARQIRDKWPVVYEEYQDWIKEGAVLGDIQIVPVSDDLSVANLAGQYDYGSRDRNTDYEALRHALRTLRRIVVEGWARQIYLPHKIGSCRGGGKWSVVKEIIQNECPNAILCRI